MPIKKQRLDPELVEKVRQGDKKAFDQIFKKYGDGLFAFSLSYLKSKEMAECLVQDIFLKIWENRRDLKKESSLKSYLFTIAYHEICQIFRKKKIHKKFLDQIIESTSYAMNLEEKSDYDVKIKLVDSLLKELPKNQLSIIIKNKNEGKSIKEIAKEMNLAEGTIMNQKSLALKFLRKKAKNF